MRRKKNQLEYRLFIVPTYDEVSKKWSTLFRLETVQEFSAFQYEIAVEEKVAERRIEWRVRGLRSPAINLPHSGPAVFTRTYNNLRGKYHFIIRRYDGTENEFILNIENEEISLLKSPKEKFLEILTSAEALTPRT